MKMPRYFGKQAWEERKKGMVSSLNIPCLTWFELGPKA